MVDNIPFQSYSRPMVKDGVRVFGFSYAVLSDSPLRRLC